MQSTYRVAALFMVCFISFGCNNSGHGSAGSSDSAAAAKAPAPKPVSKFNDTGTRMLMTVLANYYSLKDALVATNAGAANKAAAQLVTATDSLQSFLRKDSVYNVAMKPFIDTIMAGSKAIASAPDTDCEHYRLAFGTLSSAMYGMMKNAELTHAGVYHEYCPMAFNEKGAYWLSAETEIKNPYFGKKMLECGEVTDSI